MPYWIFFFVTFRFGKISFLFVSFDFISFRFDRFSFVSFNFVSFRSVSFRFVSFLFRFALYRYPIFPDYLIPKVISDYLSIALREELMITVAKYVILLVIIRSLATPYAGPHKLFKSFLKLPRCIFTVAERKQSKAIISFEKWNWKSCSAALQFRTPFERFFCFLSHVHLRSFSFILYFIRILLSIYIYTIGLGTSFYNLLVPLHTNTLIA